MTNKSKAKGNRFERFIAKELSLWLSNGENKNLLWRTHGSGARKVEGAYGDIGILTSEGHIFTDIFSVECKHYKSIDLLSELDIGEKGKQSTDLRKWWYQCCNDAFENNKLPLLIFKRNNYSPYVLLEKDVLNFIENFTGIFECKKFIFLLPRFNWWDWGKLGEQPEQVIVIKLKDFINKFDPKVLELMKDL